MKTVPLEYNELSEEELLRMGKEEASKGLPEHYQRFCEFYVEGKNKKVALVKAGFKDRPTSYAGRLLKNEKIKKYIAWLKARALNECLVNATDLLDAWVRIAFSDMTDFVDIFPHSIRLKPSDEVDGQLIKSIKMGRDGVSIELYDKMKALDNLAKYIQDMPIDWKQKLETRRLELQEEEFELKKKLSEFDNPEKADDGFIEAIKNSAKIIWEEERN